MILHQPRSTLFPYTTLFRSLLTFFLGCLTGAVGGALHRLITRELYVPRSEEHTSELQSRRDLVCRLLLEKKKALTYPVRTATTPRPALSSRPTPPSSSPLPL